MRQQRYLQNSFVARRAPSIWGERVDRYPHAEKAKGYLLGWSAAARLDPPPGEDVD